MPTSRTVSRWLLCCATSYATGTIGASELLAQPETGRIPEIGGIQWHGRLQWLGGHTAQTADGDSLDLRGATASVRAGMRLSLPVRSSTARILAEPSVGLTLNSLAGIRGQGQGVATSSSDLRLALGVEGAKWSFAGVLGVGNRSVEYRAKGPIENLVGGQRSFGLRLERRMLDRAAVSIEWATTAATLNRSEDGRPMRAVDATPVNANTLLVGWSSAFRGGFKVVESDLTPGLPPVFSFVVENDAFVDSDTGYTNGVRAMWSGWHGRYGNRLARIPLLGKSLDIGNYCPLASGMKATIDGACWIVSTALGQTMYTPSALNADAPQYDDRPFAGHLFVSVRAQRIDQMRYTARNRFVLLTASSEVSLGLKGPLAGARQTQSLAHWTWSSAAVRPTGWRDQLNNEPMGGFTIDGAARPKRLEGCRGPKGCTGTVSEQRRWDLTPRGELVVGTALVRSSMGSVLRLGRNMPSAVSLDRIPSALFTNMPLDRDEMAAMKDKPVAFTDSVSAQRLRNTSAYRWWLVFFTADLRAVARNAFIDGGFTDRGPRDWNAKRNIERRPYLGEVGVGAQASAGHWNVAVHLIHRTPEYRVKGMPEPRGVARFANITVGRSNF